MLLDSFRCFIHTGGRGGRLRTLHAAFRAGISLPSLQDLRKVSVESTSFLILIRASSTMGPHLEQKSQVTEPAEPPRPGV